MTISFDDLPEIEPSAATGFAAGRLDRRSENRPEDAVAQALADGSARVYVFQGDEVAGADTDPRLTPEAARELGASDDNMVLLGWDGDKPRLAALLPGREDDVRPGEISGGNDLRSLAMAGAFAPDVLGDLALARSLTLWNARHGYCANCGKPTRMGGGGFRRTCDACGAMHFPRTDPVVIMQVVDGDRALLGRSHRFAPGMYSCLAGFMEPGETIEDAVRRETREESGIEVGRVRYHASQPWPFPSSLMIGCHGQAMTTEISLQDDELEDCRWFDRDEVRTMMAGEHPDGLKTPLNQAIAHHLIKAWADPA